MKLHRAWVALRAPCFAAIVASAILAIVGCGYTESDESDDETTGEAQQALTSVMGCTNIVRQAVPSDVEDTQVANKLPPKNYGSSMTMNAGDIAGVRRQALLRFDLSGIPSGPSTTVRAAWVSLAEAFAPTAPAFVDVYRVNAPWGELTETWQSFGGAYNPVPESSFHNSAIYPTFDAWQMTTDWVQGTTPNHGLLLDQAGGGATTLWTSEYLNVYLRPTLHLCFDVTCAPSFADCNQDAFDGCEADLTSSLTDCGTCGNACALPNAAMTCSSGTCAFAGCDPGFLDCDGNPANGCEPAPCVNGSVCATGADCQTGFCAAGVCQTPAYNPLISNYTLNECGGTTTSLSLDYDRVMSPSSVAGDSMYLRHTYTVYETRETAPNGACSTYHPEQENPNFVPCTIAAFVCGPLYAYCWALCAIDYPPIPAWTEYAPSCPITTHWGMYETIDMPFKTAISGNTTFVFEAMQTLAPSSSYDNLYITPDPTGGAGTLPATDLNGLIANQPSFYQNPPTLGNVCP